MTRTPIRRSVPAVPPRRHRAPLVLLLLGLFVVPGATILLRERDDTPLAEAEAERRVREARRLDSEGRWDEAMAGYAQAMAAIRNRPALSAHARAWRAELAELQERARRKAALDRRFEALRREGREASSRDLQILRQDAEGWPVAWRGELDALLEATASVASAAPPSFEAQRLALQARHGKHWARLREAWEAFAADPRTTEDERRKVREELGRVQNRAKEDLRSILRKAEREEREAARRLLEGERERFAGLSCEPELLSRIGR
jgi:hypothetical protein